MVSNNAKANLLLDIPDPIDFPEPSKAPGLRSLDSALRCPICGELFDGPVTLLCGHCFCSLCIRQTLNEKPLCPTCRKSDVNEGHLRVNSAMEEAVSAWKLSRPLVLDLIAKNEAATAEPLNKKRKLDSEFEPSSSSSRSHRNDIPSDESVSCPSCGKSVKLEEINAHLDRSCRDPPVRPSSKAKTQWQNILGPKSQVGNKAKGKERSSREPEDNEPLPKKPYGVLKDKTIRELLQEHDLPAHGDRNVLIGRHQQWVIMYNANLDKSERLRKTIDALRRDLQQWEAQQKGRSKRDNIGDPGEYERQNRSEFAKLVAAAKPKKPDSTISSDIGVVDDRHCDIIVVDGD